MKINKIKSKKYRELSEFFIGTHVTSFFNILQGIRNFDGS